MNISEWLLNSCKSYFPTIVEKAVDIKQVSPWELIIKIKEGTSWSYYELNNSMRKLPTDPDDMTEEEYKREFSIRLRRLMDSKGVTQTRLAELIGKKQNSISLYCSGKILPSFYTLDKIARALDCSMDDFRYRR